MLVGSFTPVLQYRALGKIWHSSSCSHVCFPTWADILLSLAHFSFILAQPFPCSSFSPLPLHPHPCARANMSASSAPQREVTRFLVVEVHNIPQVGNQVFQMSVNAITDDVKQRVVDLMFAAGYHCRRPWFRLNRRIWLAPDPSDPTALPQAYYARCPYYRALQPTRDTTTNSDQTIVFWFQWTTSDSFRNPPHLDLPSDTTRAVIDVTD